ILQHLKYTILVKQLFLTLQPVHSFSDRSSPGQNSYLTSAPLYVLVTLPTHSVPVYEKAQPSSTRGPEVVDRNAQEKLPQTHSRLRPDDRCLENGEYEIENARKLRLEYRQQREITPDKGKINIKVKVLSLWNQYCSNNSSKLSGIDMILMDEQGTNIHATINSSIVCDFDTLLNENDYQIISNFNVKRNVDSTKLTKPEFKIQFYKKTNVRNCSEFDCNDDGMNLISFKDFVEAKIDQSYSF
nr:replication protein A 70 kDa DNA-binding subunit D-like [Tanacetum cinerariifolium]